MTKAERFIVAWQGGSSVKQVAHSLGIAAQSASIRASRYRKLGIPLKKFPRGTGPKKLDIAALKDLAIRIAA